MANDALADTSGACPDRELLDSYLALLRADDPVVRRVALRQLDRLHRRRPASAPIQGTSGPTATSGFLARLVEQAVGTLDKRSSGALEGPCPWHGSRSGRCLVVLVDGQRWWCRSCRRGGDVVAWVALTRGVSFAEARRRLGLPAVVRTPQPRVEVVRYAR